MVAAGQKVRASELNDITALIGFSILGLAATSTTSLASVPGLAVAMEAGSTYILDGCIFYQGATGADMKIAFNVPSGGAGGWGLSCAAPSVGTSGIGDMDATRVSGMSDSSTQVAGCAGTSVPMVCLPRGYATTAGTAGNLQVRMAQNASNATATTILAGSWIRLLKVDS